jgi:transmembrane sensor
MKTEPLEDVHDDESTKRGMQQHIRQALAPFEDALIARLPSPEQIVQQAIQRKQQRQSRNKKILSLLIFAATGGLYYWDPVYQQHQLVSAIGQQKDFILADGSRVRLNTATQLQVAYHLRSRRILLQQGEASFAVQHNIWHSWLPWAERRFEVAAGQIRIEDIGTVFNVRKLNQSDAQVAVEQGKVRVWSADRQQSFILNSGQSLGTERGHLSASVDNDAAQLIAWQKGYYYFNDQSLAQVLAELNRYGKLPVQIDPALAGLRISGQADLQQRMQLIQALPQFAPVRLTKDLHGQMWIKAKK